MKKQKVEESTLEDQRKINEKLRLHMAKVLREMPSTEDNPELMDEFRAIGVRVRSYLREERVSNSMIFNRRHKL